MSSAMIFLFFKPFGHILIDDSPGKAFDDGRLADAGLADEDRIVLGAARQHLNDAADLFVAADHGIELAAARQLSQIAAVLFQRLVFRFRILIGHALRASHLREHLENPILCDLELLEDSR